MDATAHQQVAQQYQIQGFPTIKVFGADKSKPVDYQGQRTADGIVSEAMKAVNKLVKDRKAGKSKTSGTSGESEKSGKSKDGKKSSGSKKNGGGAAITLDETNFNALVMESGEHWLVEFMVSISIYFCLKMQYYSNSC